MINHEGYIFMKSRSYHTLLNGKRASFSGMPTMGDAHLVESWGRMWGSFIVKLYSG